MKITSIINQKGGVGKTTTVINVGGALALMGKKILLVDLDPQGNLSSGLNIPAQEIEKKNVYFALVGQSKLSENVCSTAIKNLYVVPSNNNLAGAEVELVDVERREFRLKESLSEALNQYDFVFIDCPPSLGMLTLNALSASNSFLIPMQSEFFAMQGLSNILQTAKLVKKHLNPALEEEGVLLTMFDSRSNLSKQVYSELRSHIGNRLYNSIIPRRVRLAESTSHGVPGVIYDPTCFGSRSYVEVAKEFLLRSQGLKLEPIKKQTFLPPDPVDRLGNLKSPVPAEAAPH
jgi:chromosome partitioning protein